MSERKDGKASTILPPQPNGPVVPWDFNQRAKAGQVLKSEPNIMIWPYKGRAWDQRGTENLSRSPVARRQQFFTKTPKPCG